MNAAAKQMQQKQCVHANQSSSYSLTISLVTDNFEYFIFICVQSDAVLVCL